MSKHFGTDGIRGIANKELTPELAFRVGKAVSHILGKGSNNKIIIGKDTRLSGDMLESALIAGICSMGIDVVSLGVVPTPAVAYLTRKYEALAGIVISASHNPGEYNGIKIFNGEGLKLCDEKEEEIENIINNNIEETYNPTGKEIGRVIKEKNGSKDYIDYLMSITELDLTGTKIVIDCGHGALYKIGPELMRNLGAEVIVANDEPDGMNINDNCGSTNPEIVQKLVVKEGADLGISFDGDGDRIIAVDNEGVILNGDHILAICGTYLHKHNRLKNNAIVGTIMTNMGLDVYLEKMGIDIIKTDVGDRYVLEEMLNNGYALGGEQSGHIIFLEYNTTGDGLATALHLLEVMKESNKTMAELNNLMTDYPQVLFNAAVDNSWKYKYLENQEIKEKIEEIENHFQGEGRVIIRPSGTEPCIRVMIEGKDIDNITIVAKELVQFIEERIGLI